MCRLPQYVLCLAMAVGIRAVFLHKAAAQTVQGVVVDERTQAPIGGPRVALDTDSGSAVPK